MHDYLSGPPKYLVAHYFLVKDSGKLSTLFALECQVILKINTHILAGQVLKLWMKSQQFLAPPLISPRATFLIALKESILLESSLWIRNYDEPLPPQPMSRNSKISKKQKTVRSLALTGILRSSRLLLQCQEWSLSWSRTCRVFRYWPSMV